MVEVTPKTCVTLPPTRRQSEHYHKIPDSASHYKDELTEAEYCNYDFLITEAEYCNEAFLIAKAEYCSDFLITKAAYCKEAFLITEAQCHNSEFYF